jgi:hypothetical protein
LSNSQAQPRHAHQVKPRNDSPRPTRMRPVILFNPSQMRWYRRPFGSRPLPPVAGCQWPAPSRR